MTGGADARILRTLLAHLHGLSLTPALEIAWPGMNFPVNGSEKPDNYLEATFLPNKTRQVTFGDDPQQQRGLLQVSVLWKSGQGVMDALDVAGQVIRHFRHQYLFSSDGTVRVVIDGEPWASPNLPDGDRMRWPVSIPYHAYEKEA
ncbi:phage tail terminator-like protein [Roseibium sp. RKSG952]|uniref:phage tail terminator-like protein n=1 Tax=Roseibium sp. RKSG952 TaxID=2529384 RepID=UPI0012BD0E2D|nr:phage tail terminator-like protein [Roseibium sp. RKSG952]MTH96419.1 hypothetical protein [Roseibium sp. RKSG952]